MILISVKNSIKNKTVQILSVQSFYNTIKNFTKELTWRRLYHANSRLVYMDGDKQDGYKDL